MVLQSITSLGNWALDRAKSKIAKRGVGGTIRWALTQVVVIPKRYLSRRRAHQRELAWDRAHGVDTAGIINTPVLTLQAGYAIDAYAYQGCDPDVIVGALDQLPIRFSDYSFVDLGSGKGRALMSVRELGFRRIIGVEFSPVLCDVARRNWERLKAKDADYPQWDVICADATTFEPEGPTVVMLYNPFGPEIMKKVIERLEGRRDILVVYFNPTQAAEWERSGKFHMLYSSADYRVYGPLAGLQTSRM